MRSCRFKGMTQEFVEKLIRHDFDLIKAMQKLQREVDKFGVRPPKPKHLPVSLLQKHVIDIVNMFKEREVICNIEAVDLSRTYEKIKEELREPVDIKLK